MGASFRNIDEIIELAGCDLLTISPKLLDQLKRTEKPLNRKLNPLSSICNEDKLEITKEIFTYSDYLVDAMTSHIDRERQKKAS